MRVQGNHLLGLVFLLVLGACGSGTSSNSSSQFSSTIEDGATDVATDTVLTVTFDAAVDTDTVTEDSFFMAEGGPSSDITSLLASFDSVVCDADMALDASVECASDTECSLTPAEVLDPETEYTVCLTEDIQLLSGTFVPTSFSFTTEASSGFTVGGTVSGLSGTVVLQNNAGDDLSLTEDGAFTFDTSVADGEGYEVTVLTQPDGQACEVSNDMGTISGANVTNVAVTCSSNSFTVSITPSGVRGTVTFLLNSNEQLPTTDDDTITFSTELEDDEDYTVSVHSTSAQTVECVVNSGSGTVNGADVNLTATCTSTIILFDGGAHTNGNLGGRSGADAMCDTAADSEPLDCIGVTAFLSVDANDEIRDMPDNYGVPTDAAIVSTGDMLIFADWADMLDGNSLVTSLNSAGVMGTGHWWSGTTTEGALDDNCDGWTNSSAVAAPNLGNGTATDSNWIAFSSPSATANCSGGNTSRVLCLCY